MLSSVARRRNPARRKGWLVEARSGSLPVSEFNMRVDFYLYE